MDNIPDFIKDKMGEQYNKTISTYELLSAINNRDRVVIEAYRDSGKLDELINYYSNLANMFSPVVDRGRIN